MSASAAIRSRLGHTPWQTVGPFFHYALPWEGGGILVRPDTLGERIAIAGQVLDAEGAPVPDAMIEIWQANAAGRYRHRDDTREELPLDAGFAGFGRMPTDAEGWFRFETVRPGTVPGPGNRMQAPHIAVGMFGRGLLRRLATRLYFPDEPGNADDPVLCLVPEDRRATLIARFADDRGSDGTAHFRFDVVLQGKHETVFFDF